MVQVTIPILLCAVNATYQYPSFGLRYLWANMGDLNSQTGLREFTLKQDPDLIVEEILACSPRIVGIGAYIWNIERVEYIAEKIKEYSPEIHLVVGGPEVSHELEGQKICEWADVVIQGEADLLFSQHCRNVFSSSWKTASKPQVITGPLPELAELCLPYHLYTEEDLKFRHVCVEVSRGCPFKCQYCLSSLDKSVRHFDVEKFLAEMEKLFLRGARQFKFIDRTFNLSPDLCDRVLRFFLERIDQDLFLHFEMVPDRLPPKVREIISQFPKGALQFEIGLQTLNEEVAKRISRFNIWEKVVDNFNFLTQQTQVHIHADLILGLPGETLESFANGFDRLFSLRPDEIQLGILKRLKGTPIVQHSRSWKMTYSKSPPFQILETSVLGPEQVRKMERFSKYWDRVHNSGDFRRSIRWLSASENPDSPPSVFWEFWKWVEYVDDIFPSPYGVSLLDLTRAFFDYLTQIRGFDFIEVRKDLAKDYSSGGRREIPSFLRDAALFASKRPVAQRRVSLKKRQMKRKENE